MLARWIGPIAGPIHSGEHSHNYSLQTNYSRKRGQPSTKVSTEGTWPGVADCRQISVRPNNANKLVKYSIRTIDTKINPLLLRNVSENGAVSRYFYCKVFRTKTRITVKLPDIRCISNTTLRIVIWQDSRWQYNNSTCTTNRYATLVALMRAKILLQSRVILAPIYKFGGLIGLTNSRKTTWTLKSALAQGQPFLCLDVWKTEMLPFLTTTTNLNETLSNKITSNCTDYGRRI